MTQKRMLLPLGITLCIGLAFAGYYRVVNTNVEREIQLRIYEVLHHSSQGLQRTITDIFHTLETAATAIETFAAPSGEALVFLGRVRSQNQFRRMGIINPEGKAVTTDGHATFLGDRPYFTEGMNGREALSDILHERLGEMKGTSINVYAVPLRRTDEHIAGVLFATYSTEYLSELLSISIFRGRAYSYVMRGNGGLVAAKRDEAIANFEKIIQALSGQLEPHVAAEDTSAFIPASSAGIRFDLDGQIYHAFSLPLGVNDLYMLSVIPDSVIRDEVAARTGQTAILIAVLIVLASIMLVYVRKMNKKMELETLHAREEAAASKAKSAFVSTMSHEIRTPLNAIVGFLHLLGKTKLSDTQQDYLRKIGVSADALLQTINDVLDFSKIEAGRMELEQVVFNLETLLNAVHSIVSVAAAKKGVDLFVEAEDDVPLTLYGDPTRLTQVLLNLLNNAIKFTEKGYVRLHVSLAIDTRPPVDAEVSLAFSVQDTGIGLSEEQIGRLFHPFSQADTSTTRRYGGTGLGLVICRQLVHLMHGSISVNSEEGKGSEFFFTARLKKATQAEAASALHESTDIATPSHWCGVPVLVVEDNEINQEIIGEVLRSFGLDITLAENGVEAIEKATHTRFAIIFMDMQMPVMDGLEASLRLRDLGAQPASPAPWLCTTPIVALTANAMLEDRRRCLDAGMSDYLSKPIDFQAIRQCLHRWLGSTSMPVHQHYREHTPNTALLPNTPPGE